MAKISPVSIKYNVLADFSSEGPVEKPDVIGALFGQTEGLLGSDMELRELQKEGKIGRIDVELETERGKTTGEITIPSALDKTETTIIAAALETIDKIGPTDAKITIKEIEDVRGSKRDYIMERAKKLLGQISGTGMDSKEIERELRESTRISKIESYGHDGLSAGDLSGDEIIVVEGRADVVNLLRYGIKNVIGMNGTKFSQDIVDLGKDKELTLFVDGDRGGKLIAKNVCDNAKVKYVAVAPDGKEVEELTGKEILQALRKKVSTDEFLGKSEKRYSTGEALVREKRELTNDEISKVRQVGSDIRGRKVILLDSKLEFIKELPASKLGFFKPRDGFVLIAENATKNLAYNAKKLGIYNIAAKTFGNINDEDIKLISI